MPVIIDGTTGVSLIQDNTVTTAKIVNGAVVTADIADANVTGAKLEDSGVVAGIYGDSSNVPRVTLDSKGRVTSVTTQAIASSAPTTAQVLTATAGATAGAVGTYAFAGENANMTTAPGATRAGSNLRYAGVVTPNLWSNANGVNAIGPIGSTIALSGTWRAMGSSTVSTVACQTALPATLWLRIS